MQAQTDAKILVYKNVPIWQSSFKANCIGKLAMYVNILLVKVRTSSISFSQITKTGIWCLFMAACPL